jgi:thioredoxin-like negative regulator of GroEL
VLGLFGWRRISRTWDRIERPVEHIKDVMIRQLTKSDYEVFVRQKRAAAVHFDAEWDVSHRTITRLRMSEAADVLAEHVCFGEVDCDREVELAKSIRVLNLPTVAYYLDGNLATVLVGARQNILGRLERLLRGQAIVHEDGLGSGDTP